MEILQISDDIEKKNIARFILEALPDWFGIPESSDEYIEESNGKIFFCAYKDENPIGFLYLKQTGKDTVELAVMGVLKEYHRNGIGKSLFECAKQVSIEQGYSFIQVKTVQQGNTSSMTKRINFIVHLGLRSLKCFQHCGMSGILVKST